MKILLKIFGMILLSVILYLAISSSSCEEDSCCNGHGDYELTSVKYEEHDTMFSCKSDENITVHYLKEQYRYRQAEKAYDYIINKLKNDEFNNSKAIIFNHEVTLEKFGCQVIYWNECSTDECLENETRKF